MLGPHPPAQRVPIRIREVIFDRVAGVSLLDRVRPTSNEQDIVAAVDGVNSILRLLVGAPLTDSRPRPLALQAGERAHLHLVDRAELEVREVDAGRRRGQGAGLLVVGVGSGVVGPGGGFLTRGGLLAVLGVVAGDGQAVGGRGRPCHVQRRIHRHVGRRAGHRWRVRRACLHVGQQNVYAYD